MAIQLPSGKNYYSTATGIPLVGGKVYAYVPGTSTPKDTYTTSAASVANTNPVILDSRGEAVIYWVGSYDVVLKDASNATIWGPERLEDGSNTLTTDLASTSDVAKGDALVGVKLNATGSVARTQHAKNADTVSVKDFGAVGDGSTDDTASIQAALDASDCIWFPLGTYITSSTVRASRAVNIDCAPGAVIKATSGTFNGTAITKAGAPFTLKALIAVFSGTNIGSQTDARIGESGARVFIGKLELDCNNKADYGVLLNCCPGAHVKANVRKAQDTGIWAGTFCWGTQFDHNRIMDCVSAGLYIGEGGNGATVICPEIWGNSVTTTKGLYVDGAEAGTLGATGQVSVTGGYIEKCVKGAYLQGNGHLLLNSVDIEAITGNAIHADMTAGATNGMVSAIDCNLASTAAAIKNTNALIRVRGGSITDGGTLEPYLSDTEYSLFDIADVRQVDSSGVPTTDPALTTALSTVFSSHTKEKMRTLSRRKTAAGGSYGFNYEHYNFTSPSQPEIISSGLAYLSKEIGDAPNTNWSYASIFARITDTNAGTPRSKSEVRLNIGFVGSEVKTIYPDTDADVNLGSASFRYNTVYASVGAINTSDAREKQQIRGIDDAEREAGKDLRGMLRAFKFNDAVSAKGSGARIHFGVIAQDVEAVFKKHGLDPDLYGLFCRDMVNGEERLGVRYEELFALILCNP